MRVLRSGNFWIGVVVGAVAVPFVLKRVGTMGAKSQ